MYRPPEPAELHRRTLAALREIGYPEEVGRLDESTGHSLFLDSIDPHHLWRARTIAGGQPMCYDHWLGMWMARWQPGEPVPPCDVRTPFLLVENCGRLDTPS
jgi:hypothetical protein